MYKTCAYCGIVPEDHKCPHKKRKRIYGNRQSDQFRKTKSWTNRSIEIRQRDRYMCRVCEADLYNTVCQFNFNKVEVHHIIPIQEDYNRRLDNDNLITLCDYHHKLAERGEIPREELFQLVQRK